MVPKKLFAPEEKGRPMRVAGFLSGSGTNIRRILEHEKALSQRPGGSPYHVVFLFSDRSDGACSGEAIALEYGIPYCSYDIRRYHRLRGLRRDVSTEEGMKARRAYDRVARTLLEAFEIDIVALGGYMSYTTIPNCVNVHPADLSILDADGKRKYVGDKAVHDAIRAGEKYLRASTLWTDAGVDTGPLLMLSEPIAVELPAPLETLLADQEEFSKIADQHQERLKRKGDWKIFPRTIQLIAEGRMALDRNGRLYVDGTAVEGGYREPCQEQ
jgi:folate-dependent phosphoribosylglycinamide formyltransferase PurN